MTSNSKPTVLVIGATSKIGRVLVQELHRTQDTQVVAAVRSSAKADQFKAQGIETQILDLEKPERYGLETIQSAFRGIERVFLLTGYDVSMLGQSKAVVDAAKNAGVSHIVHMGAYATDDTTIVHLGWHQLIERYIEWSGFSFTHLRPNWFMQNLLAYGGRGNQNAGVITQYIGDARVSWVDCDDIARAAATILCAPSKHSGKTYPLAVEAATMQEVADIFTEVVGQPFRYEPREPEEFLESVLSAGANPAYMKCVYNVFTRTREGSLRETADVFNTFEQITGQKPTSLREFAKKHRNELDYSGEQHPKVG